MTPSHDRIVFLDTSRAMAMFLVVFAHLYASDSKECLYIYAFHMPFFFFVSGMLHKEMSIVGGKKICEGTTDTIVDILVHRWDMSEVVLWLALHAVLLCKPRQCLGGMGLLSVRSGMVPDSIVLGEDSG